MRVRDLIADLKVNESLTQKDMLMNELKKLTHVIEKFENGGELKKDDLQKTDVLKDLIRAMIKDDEEKKIISDGK